MIGEVVCDNCGKEFLTNYDSNEKKIKCPNCTYEMCRQRKKDIFIFQQKYNSDISKRIKEQ